MNNKSLLLIDGNNLINRTYFSPGFSNLETQDGKRVGALYGFFRTLFFLIERCHDYRPVVCWDGGKSPRRLELFPEYKKRDKKEDTTGQMPLYEQIGLAEDLLASLGVVSIKKRYVEADDIISFLSLKAKNSIIYSNDKDFAQLVRPGCQLCISSYSGEDFIDYMNFEETWKLNIKPTEVKYFLALCGDRIDGIPGVPKIGESTAIRLLHHLREQEYYKETLEGSLEGFKKAANSLVNSGEKNIWRYKNVEPFWNDFLTSLAAVDLYRDDILTEDEKEFCLQKLEEELSLEKEKIEKEFCDLEFLLDLEAVFAVLEGEQLAEVFQQDFSDLFDYI